MSILEEDIAEQYDRLNGEINDLNSKNERLKKELYEKNIELGKQRKINGDSTDAANNAWSELQMDRQVHGDNIEKRAAAILSAAILSANKWKHACLCACDKIKRLKNIVDLQNYMMDGDAKEIKILQSQIDDWQYLYSRLGGDDWSGSTATPDSVYELANELIERERACVAYSIAEELGTVTDEIRFGEDFEATVRQVKEDAKQMRLKLRNITIAYDGEQKRVEQAEDRFAREASLRYEADLKLFELVKQVELVEGQLAEYIEIVKNFVKNMGSPPVMVPNLVPVQTPSLEFTYTCSCDPLAEQCVMCGGSIPSKD